MWDNIMESASEKMGEDIKALWSDGGRTNNHNHFYYSTLVLHFYADNPAVNPTHAPKSSLVLLAATIIIISSLVLVIVAPKSSTHACAGRASMA